MATVPLSISSLQHRYDELRDRYDSAGIRFKFRYRVLSLVAHLCTWLTLLSVVYALIQPPGSDVPHVVLRIVTPILGGLGFVTTLLLWIDLQGRWKFYRYAAENLRGECMRFRLGLKPYDGPNALVVFNRTLDRIANRADNRQGEPLLDQWRWRYYLDLAWIPAHLNPNVPHTPDSPLSLNRATRFDEEEMAVLNGRLDNQELWHLRKARQYFRRWVFGFQLPILLIHAGNVALGLLVDRFLWAVAVSTSVSLMLYALRDLLGYGPLFNRYLRVAGNLRDVRKAYDEQTEPFDVPIPANPVRLLALHVERILAAEYEDWFVGTR